MKAEVSSSLYARTFYGEGWFGEATSDNPEFYRILQTIGIAINPILENLRYELDSTELNIFETLNAGGERYMKDIVVGFSQLGGKVKEQLASLFLRQKFGAPGDPIVTSVFAELAQREVLGAQEVKEAGVELKNLLTTLEYQLVEKIRLAIAAQLNRVEEEILNYKKAQKDAQKIVSATPAIMTEVDDMYSDKFAAKFNQLEVERERWITLLELVTNTFSFTRGERQGRVVFEAAKQRVAPSKIAYGSS